MAHANEPSPTTPAEFYRSPDQIMRLSRMGSAHPMRLSFLRVLLRRVAAEGWTFDRPVWDVDAKGVGRAVYCARGPVRTYSLVAFSHDLPAEMRSDRVIATAWDATFTLFDGVPTVEDLDRLQSNVPYQEAGRITDRELSLSRANRSVRLFEHVVDALARGTQPDVSEIDAVGYLMRTTAVYGSGKFGAADRAAIADRTELSAPFQVEMLSVWLTRWFTIDIVNHLARSKGGEQAATLDMDRCHRLGVGNSTGLGMAPFLVRHPILINNWMYAREEAFARVRSLGSVTEQANSDLRAALDAAIENARLWKSEHPLQVSKLHDLRRDLTLFKAHLINWPNGANPWNELWLWAENTLSEEGQEAVVSIMLEPHGDLIDDLAGCMRADERARFRIDGAVSVQSQKDILQKYYAWALEIDFDQEDQSAQFWYVSEEKLEPRLGERFAEEGDDLEQPLCVARLAKSLYSALEVWSPSARMAEFLLAHPEHRLMVRRAQQAPKHPYAELRDNLIARDMLPIDLMRCKLAFFGATHFDPRSDKWVRISLFSGAPYPFEIGAGGQHEHV
jgi:hypothetical protein